MNKLLTLTLTIILLCMGGIPMSGQIVWPGDVNNNGHVSGMDLLYLGTRINSNGFERPNPSTNWNGQQMGNSWNQFLPGTSTDLAHADANGDGSITESDWQDAIIPNYGFTHDLALPDFFAPDGTEGIDPALSLKSEITEAALGTHLEFELSLGSEDIAIQDFYGIIFSIKYDTTFVEGGLTFEKDASWWIDPTNGRTRFMVVDNPETGVAEITITRINQINVNGNGLLGTIAFDLVNDDNIVLPATFKVDFTDVKMVDVQMNSTPLFLNGLSLAIVGSVTTPTNCPDIVAPVCGANGVTYLNNCYAEAAGVTDYTEGVCYSDCIDPNLINPSANCGTDYNPVSGCNGIVYINECAAIAAGVTTYTSGVSNNSCYDPNYVVTSAGTSVDDYTGIITVNCTADYNPVCGCDGITYDNACLAEASGITFYTQGTCDDICVDPSQMDPDANCPTVYDPVCGCNGVTYSNDCYANAAGVMTYTYGVCGGSSPWCAEAIPIQCGDFLANETTIGAGNNIVNYPGCTPYAFAGADKVYVINKTTAGDLQIGLEITTPGLDLDLFLLSDNCSQISCLRSSTTNNNVTNNEGILYEDAPLGTYYIVVDGQHASSQGNYRLEVNCGYLYCGDAAPLDCSVPFYGNNINGHDDVSLYGCDGNVFNVENNGPEMVHYFTTTVAGEVTVLMTGLSANLELFLLRSCDRGDCIDYSQNSGTGNESITAWLQPGTYYVVVDGYNGAISDYSLIVDCVSGCDLNYVSVTSTPTSCGQTDGSITLVSSGGTPGYIISYSGPISGSFYTYSNDCTISHLPAGTYTITKVGAGGCHVSEQVTVYSSGNLNLTLDPSDAACGGEGSVNVWINGGSAPYYVYVSGPENENFTTYSADFDITGLPTGYYAIHITDATGCSVSQQFTIEQGGGDFDFSGTPHPGSCGELGYIHIDTWEGTYPYNIHVQGPVSGYASTNASSFNIINLPGGTYTITIEDGNWCTHSEIIVLAESNIDITATAINGACGGYGSILVDMSNGTGPYTVNWSGPISGSTSTNNSTYTIGNLPSGNYQITVEDANWCTDYAVVQINNSGGGGLSINVVPLDGNCDDLGALWVDINDGVAPYYITWSGPVSGSNSTYDDGFDIPNLPAGCYTVYITDSNGCSNSQYVCLSAGGSIDVDLTTTSGYCGQNGSIEVNITGGSPDYTITWNGPSSGSVTVNVGNYTIPNLPSGTYTVNVSDGNNCTDYAAIQIDNSSGGQLVLNATPLDGACNQLGGIWLDIIGGSAPYTVSWTGPVSGTQNINTNGINISDLPAGNYWLYVTDNNGCTGSTNVVVSQNNDLQISLSSTDASCNGYGSIYVYTSYGTGPYSITWSGPSSGSTTTDQNNYNIPNLPPGYYSIWVTDANGCSADNNISINVVDDLQVSLNPENGACGQNGAIWVDINGGAPSYTVSWSGPQNGSVNTNASFNIPNLIAGTYTVTVTDINGCTDYAVVVISTSEDDLYITAVPTNGQCGSMGSIHVGISGGNPNFTITWSGPVSGSAVLVNSFYDITNLPSGTYYITVTDANGCFDTTTVTIDNSSSDLDIATTLVVNDCGQYNWIWVDITGGWPTYTITWTGPQNGSGTTDGNGFEIIDLPPGDYIVKVTDIHGCMVSTTVTIYDAPVELLVLTGDNGDCDGYGSITATIIDGLADYQISWTGPVSGSITTSSTTYTIENLPSGTYTVTLLDGNWCTDIETITINTIVSDLEIATTLVVNDCGQYNWIWVDITGGWPTYTITWTGPQNGSGTTDDNGFEIIDLPPGDYIVKVTDIHGCMVTTTVTIYDAPVELLVLTGDNGDCDGYGSITATIIDGLANYQISWTGPVSGSITTSSTTYTIENLPSGTYTVTLLDGNWCTDIETITINAIVSDLEISTTLVVNDCGQYNWIWVDITGGWPTYTITWTGPQNGSGTTDDNGFEIIDLPPGIYIVKVTDIHGCMVTTTVTIYDAPVELLVLTTTNGLCNEPGSITATIIDGLADYQISWTGPVSGFITTSSPTYTIPNLPSGTYTVTLLDGNWCTDIETIIVNGGIGGISIIAVPVNGACGENGSIWLDIYDGVGPYVITWTGPVSGSTTTTSTGLGIPNLPGGTYIITVVDANGCTVSTMVVIVVSEDDLDAIAVPFDGDCDGAGYIHVGIVGGSPIYTLSWSGPVSGGIATQGPSYNIEDLPAGTYTITVIDANGCEDVEVVTINAISGGLDVSTMVSNGFCGGLGNIWMDFYNGTAPYTITWTGTVSGSDVTLYDYYDIVDLPTGTYTVTVTDVNGCTYTQVITIVNVIDDLTASLTAIQGGCGVPGAIQVNVIGGSPSYTYSWTSSNASGSFTTSNATYIIQNLPTGIYTISIEDMNGCGEILSIQLLNYPTNLQVYTTPVDPTCTQEGSIGLVINGGTPNYTITWEGAATGSTSINTNNYVISNLPGGDYTINITDTGGCYSIQNVTLDGTPETPEVGFTYQISGLSVAFTNQSAGGTYAWTFGDGGTSTLTSPGHAYAASGTYEVCLTVTNACGSSSTCEMITVMSGADAAILDIGEVAGGAGTMAYVPVRIQNCNLLVSLAGSIQVDDIAVGELVGVSAGVILPQLNLNNHTFNYYDNSGEGIVLNDGDILFYFNVQLTGNTGSESGIRLMEEPLAIEVGGIQNDNPTVLPHIIVPGSVEIANVGTVVGNVTTFWDDGIEDVALAITGSGMNETETTNEDGLYTLNNVPLGHEYTFEATKDDAPANGLSTYSLFIGQRFILGMDPPQVYSPYQVIAGDANCNGSFSTLDLFLIQQLIIGATDEFTSCPSWVFVSSDNAMPEDFTAQNVFPYNSQSTMMVFNSNTVANFVGVKVGDILGNANPNGFQSEDLDERTDGELIFTTDNRQILAGEYIDIPVTSSNFNNIVSYQMGLRLVLDKLSFIEFTPSTEADFSNTAAAYTDGELRISWFNTQGLASEAAENEVLFSIRVQALENIDNLSELITISAQSITAQAHTMAGEAWDVNFQFNGVTGTTYVIGEAFKLYQNQPNPFEDKTIIRFDLPSSMDAELIIHDKLGRVIKQFSGFFSKGENKIEVSELNLDAGVYFYTLKAGDFTRTKSMVVLR